MLQDWEESPEQFAPPLAGAGLLQLLLWVPPPQLAEQADQSDQPPFTGGGGVTVYWADTEQVFEQLLTFPSQCLQV